MNDNPSIVYNGEHAQANVNAGSGSMTVNNNYMHVRSFEEASSGLRSWYNCAFADKHFERVESKKILEWISTPIRDNNPSNRVSLLVGDAGTGKSVIMRELLETLEGNGTKVLGLKSDLLFANNSDLDKAVGFNKPVASEIADIADQQQVVLLVDQIDALSSTLSSSRTPLLSINALVDAVSRHHNVRVVVSCRPYDWQYDPALERYKHGNIIHIQGLPIENVEETLASANIRIDKNEDEVKQFLTNPLNLFLFCRIKNGSVFNSQRPNRTLLFEALWKQIVVDGVTDTEMVSENGVTTFLDSISSEMYKKQTLA